MHTNTHAHSHILYRGPISAGSAESDISATTGAGSAPAESGHLAYLYPTVQMGLFGVRHDERIVSSLLR